MCNVRCCLLALGEKEEDFEIFSMNGLMNHITGQSCVKHRSKSCPGPLPLIMCIICTQYTLHYTSGRGGYREYREQAGAELCQAKQSLS